MTEVDGVDPIWNEPARVFRISADDHRVKSARTGNFTKPAGFVEYIQNWDPIDKAKISTWILDRNLAGEWPEITQDAMREIEARKPLRLSQKIDRFLMMLEAKRFRPGDALPWQQGVETLETVKGRHQTMLWIEAASDHEFYVFSQVLLDGGILAQDQASRLILGMAGYERLERLRQGGAGSQQAFVAMWFDPSTRPAYDQGIEPALIDAGYQPVRIDRKEHNNKIDDEIIAEIRKSRFVVADFTCGILEQSSGTVALARGGVYYEAGFAQGLGIPVIWTVQADQIGLVHFDTRQYNHIAWSGPDDLRARLYNRVVAVIGVFQGA